MKKVTREEKQDFIAMVVGNVTAQKIYLNFIEAWINNDKEQAIKAIGKIVDETIDEDYPTEVVKDLVIFAYEASIEVLKGENIDAIEKFGEKFTEDEEFIDKIEELMDELGV